MIRQIAVAGLAAATVLLAASCGDDERLTILAAASLRSVVPTVAPDARVSFGGSDRIAFQVAEGAPADIVLSASREHTRDLRRRGLVEAPVPFARNRLVIVVPAGNPGAVRVPRDLARPGVRVALADAGVPAGDYARRALSRMNLSQVPGRAVGGESDVSAVLARVVLGEVDAGLVYTTDARAAGGRVTGIDIPEAAQPDIVYEGAVVADSERADEARAFLRRLAGAEGREALAGAGFVPLAP